MLKFKKNNKNTVEQDLFFLYNKNSYYAAIITSIIVLSALGSGYIILRSRPMISTSYYHFNIQYRCGLESSYDEIVENTFQQIVWMYGNHSSWKYTIRCQFMLIEYIYDNYRHIFDAIQEQNANGQLELIIPQYSNSWQVPYPIRDFRQSINYTGARLEEWNLKRSRLILLQEGQWLPAFGQLGDTGNFKAGIISREQTAYFNYFPDQPVLRWNFKGVSRYAYVIPWMPTLEGGVYHHQIYTADGEMANTRDDKDTFTSTAENFELDPVKQANLEARLVQLEKMGNTFMHMEEFFDYCLENGYVGDMDKYIPECEWVCAKHEAFYTWMGNGNGETDDGYMLARNYYARNLAQATELFLDKAYGNGIITDKNHSDWCNFRIAGSDGKLLEANKLIWEAQVSDTTGINPRYYEFWYGMNKTEEAISKCWEIIHDIKNAPGDNIYSGGIQINPFTQEIYNETGDFINDTLIGTLFPAEFEGLIDSLTIEVTQNEAYLPLPLVCTTNFENRTLKTVDWEINYCKLNYKFYGKYNITLEHNTTNYIPLEGSGNLSTFLTEGTPGLNEISVKFKDDWSQAVYSPTLMENDTVLVNRSEYFSYPHGSTKEWHVLLSLCNGMLYNPKRGYAIIKNNTVRHLCADWRGDYMEFRETKVKYNSEHEYFLVKGKLAEILRFANQVNAYAYMNMN